MTARKALSPARVERRGNTSGSRLQEVPSHHASFEALPDMMFLLSSEGVMLDYQVRDPRELYTQGPIIGRRLDEFLPEWFANGCRDYIGRTLAHGLQTRWTYALEVSGEMRQFLATFFPSGPREVLALVRQLDAPGAPDSRVTGDEPLGALGRALLAHEEERRALAHELREETAQVLTSIAMRLAALESAPVLDDERGALQSLRELAHGAERTVVELAHALRPVVLDDHGLGIAVERLARHLSERHGLTIDTHRSGFSEAELAAEVKTAAYRIVEEVLANVVAHARAHHASVLLLRRGDELTIAVDDDGLGFDTANTPRGLGLTRVYAWAELRGGGVKLESHPHRGTTVAICLPLVGASGAVH